MCNSTVAIFTSEFLASFAYFKNNCHKTMKLASKYAEGSTSKEHSIHIITLSATKKETYFFAIFPYY